jgi:hypothetical protein
MPFQKPRAGGFSPKKPNRTGSPGKPPKPTAGGRAAQSARIRAYRARAKRMGITQEQFETPAMQADIKRRRAKTRAKRRAERGL